MRSLPGRVRFLGRLSKHDLHDRVRSARVVAVPSRCHENQPMSILEAYGLSTPVVATRLGGIPELVVDDVTGVIVEPEDPTALAEGIARVASSIRHAAKMGVAGRELVERAFSPDDPPRRPRAALRGGRHDSTGGGTVMGRGLVVFSWHNIESTPAFPTRHGRGVQGFERQLRHLARFATVLPLEPALDALYAGETLPRRAVCLTFDDGYCDNLDLAVPLLRRYGLPATFFLVPAFLDQAPGGVVGDVGMGTRRLAT